MELYLRHLSPPAAFPGARVTLAADPRAAAPIRYRSDVHFAPGRCDKQPGLTPCEMDGRLRIRQVPPEEKMARVSSASVMLQLHAGRRESLE